MISEYDGDAISDQEWYQEEQRYWEALCERENENEDEEANGDKNV
jgi:hypothetical protein